MKYAILARHHGWIDELLSAGFEPTADAKYPDRVCTGAPREKIATFDTREAAEALAARCNEHWAAIEPDRPWARWKFAVVHEVMVPRWRIVDPKSARERVRSIGLCEQI